jgi:hypothetical protein
MVSRTTVMTLPIAAALALAGCSGTDESESGSSPATEQTTSAQATASESAPATTEATDGASDEPEASNDVDDLPDYVKPYPDSEVVSASIVKAHNDKDSKKPEQISLVVRAKAETKDIFAYYEKELGKADYEPLGDEVKTKSARVLNFRHKDNDSVLVVTVADDAGDKKHKVVTIGGNIVP